MRFRRLLSTSMLQAQVSFPAHGHAGPPILPRRALCYRRLRALVIWFYQTSASDVFVFFPLLLPRLRSSTTATTATTRRENVELGLCAQRGRRREAEDERVALGTGTIEDDPAHPTLTVIRRGDLDAYMRRLRAIVDAEGRATRRRTLKAHAPRDPKHFIDAFSLAGVRPFGGEEGASIRRKKQQRRG
ncbi:hypothetical protein FB107DRAFT_252411 [Schizophyllum commune]